MTEEVLRLRRAKEEAALARLGELSARLRTLGEIHRWLFTEHAAYAAGATPPEPGSGALADSY